jgi:hypothetical protein
MKQTNVWVKCRPFPALKQVAHIVTSKQELHGSVKAGGTHNKFNRGSKILTLKQVAHTVTLKQVAHCNV